MLVDVVLPAELEDATECIVERWLHKAGERVRANEPLLEVNTDKAVVEVASPAEGVLEEIVKQTNDVVRAGEVLGRIAVGAVVAANPSTPGTGQPAGGETKPESTTTPGAGGAQLSPAVRQLIRQHNIDPGQIPGTGRGGRITAEDVQGYLATRASPLTPTPLPQGERGAGGSRKVAHTPMRRRIAQHMVESALKTSPHVTAVFEADLSAVVAHREAHKAEFDKRGVKLTYTAYFVAAAVEALKAVPEVNARWHDDGLEIFDECNIGIATAVPGGLLVPVIARAGAADLFGIAQRLQDLTAKARAGKLTPAELQGGTFTITNHGMSGSLMATPIIFQPQVAILGVGKMEKRVVVVEDGGVDAMVVKPMAYVTLTIDHRALDGFTANAFLSKLAEALTKWV